MAELGVGENTTVSLTVENVGARDGDEVIMALFMPHAGTVPEGAPAARLKQQSAPSSSCDRSMPCSCCWDGHRVQSVACGVIATTNHALRRVLLNCTAQR